MKSPVSAGETRNHLITRTSRNTAGLVFYHRTFFTTSNDDQPVSRQWYLNIHGSVFYRRVDHTARATRGGTHLIKASASPLHRGSFHTISTMFRNQSLKMTPLFFVGYWLDPAETIGRTGLIGPDQKGGSLGLFIQIIRARLQLKC